MKKRSLHLLWFSPQILTCCGLLQWKISQMQLRLEDMCTFLGRICMNSSLLIFLLLFFSFFGLDYFGLVVIPHETCREGVIATLRRTHCTTCTYQDLGTCSEGLVLQIRLLLKESHRTLVSNCFSTFRDWVLWNSTDWAMANCYLPSNCYFHYDSIVIFNLCRLLHCAKI